MAGGSSNRKSSSKKSESANLNNSSSRRTKKEDVSITEQAGLDRKRHLEENNWADFGIFCRKKKFQKNLFRQKI